MLCAAPLLVSLSLGAADEAEALRALRTIFEAGNVAPAPGSTLPRNARLLVISPGFVGNDVAFVRDAPDGSVLAALDSTALANALVVDLGELGPREEVVVEMSCSTCDGNAPLQWSTGDGDDVTAPQFRDVPDAFHAVSNGDGTFTVTADVAVDVDVIALELAADGDPPTIVRREIVDGDRAEVVLTLARTPASHVCVDITAFDAAGNATTKPEPICGDLPNALIPPGCASTPPATPLALVAALAAMRRWRR
jgi:hypothetical protein